MKNSMKKLLECKKSGEEIFLGLYGRLPEGEEDLRSLGEFLLRSRVAERRRKGLPRYYFYSDLPLEGAGWGDALLPEEEDLFFFRDEEMADNDDARIFRKLEESLPLQGFSREIYSTVGNFGEEVLTGRGNVLRKTDGAQGALSQMERDIPIILGALTPQSREVFLAGGRDCISLGDSAFLPFKYREIHLYRKVHQEEKREEEKLYDLCSRMLRLTLPRGKVIIGSWEERKKEVLESWETLKKFSLKEEPSRLYLLYDFPEEARELVRDLRRDNTLRGKLYVLPMGRNTVTRWFYEI